MQVLRTPCLVAILGLFYLLWPALAGAEPQKAGVVASLQGQATVARAVLPSPIPLKVRDDVFLHDRVDTRENSIARFLLGGKAVVTVREFSTLTITEEEGRAMVDLHGGTLALGVAKSLLRPGESIEVRTPNAIAAVRGSLLAVEVRVTTGVVESFFTALQATLPITVSPRADRTIIVPLRPNQSVGVSGVGAATRIEPVQRITPQQAKQIAKTAEAPKPPAGGAAPQALKVNLQQATFAEVQNTLRGQLLAASLLGGTEPFEAKFRGVILTGQEVPALARVVQDAVTLSPGSELKIEGAINGRPFEVRVENKNGRTEARLEGVAFSGSNEATLLLAALREQGVSEARIRGLVDGQRVEARFKDQGGRTEVKLERFPFASRDQLTNLLGTFQDVSEVQIKGLVDGRRVEAQVRGGRVRLEGISFASEDQINTFLTSLRTQGFNEVKIAGFVDGRRVEAQVQQKLRRGEESGTSARAGTDRERDRSDQSLRGRERDTPQREQAERAERVERAERAEKVERAERPEKVERAERPERVERVERPEKVERVERPERAERVERPEKVERAERPERAERVERRERIERVERPEKAERLERPERRNR